jgi:signal transduction histidine kinase
MEILRGLECGADNFLTKPYQTSDLFARIDRIFDNRRIRASQVSGGVDVVFMDHRFTITSDKERILDLLMSTFEDMVRANLELQRSRTELSAATAKIQSYATELEDRVRERTAALVLANTELQAEILARRQAQEQLAHAQKMEAIGNLTGGMAHDFNNLLGIIIGNLDLLGMSDNLDPEIKEFADEAFDAALRGADLTRRLLAFARRQPLRPVPIDVNERVESIIKLLGRTLGENIRITLHLGSEIFPVVADPAQLEACLTNLATNARDAMPSGGNLTVATRNDRLDEDYAADHSEVEPGDFAVIEVSDNGTGMSPDVLNRIFEPFYTTKEQDKGTGLGLSMVFGYIKQSGGHINVYSEPGIGTTFRLYLPRALSAAEAQTPAPAAMALGGNGEIVLAVEDNAALRRTVVRQLHDLNYRVLEAVDATTALEVLEREHVDLLFTDVVMPGASGLDIVRIVLSRWPNIRIVITSGFPQAHLLENPELFEGIRLLSKPYRKEELAATLRQAFAP